MISTFLALSTSYLSLALTTLSLLYWAWHQISLSKGGHSAGSDRPPHGSPSVRRLDLSRSELLRNME